MKSLRSRTLKLAYERPDLRSILLKAVRQADASKKKAAMPNTMWYLEDEKGFLLRFIVTSKAGARRLNDSEDAIEAGETGGVASWAPLKDIAREFGHISPSAPYFRKLPPQDKKVLFDHLAFQRQYDEQMFLPDAAIRSGLRAANRRAKRASFSEPPMPTGVREDVWERFKGDVAASVSLLERAGTKLEGYSPNDRFEYAKFRAGGYRFALNAQDLANLDQVKSVVRRWDKVLETAAFFEGISDPFYDTLHSVIKAAFGSSKGLNLAYSIVASMVKSTGKRWNS